MTTYRKRCFHLLVLAALVYPIFVFANPKDKENASEVKFTARAELVLIPALVTNKSGTHVRGLKKEDFTVFENGAEQKITTFEEITSDPHRPSRPGVGYRGALDLSAGEYTVRFVVRDDQSGRIGSVAAPLKVE
jgi:hypothetical protein